MHEPFKDFIKYEAFRVALCKAQQEGFKGIILTNVDPESDYKALIEKNRNVLEKHGLRIEHAAEMTENGLIKIRIFLIHAQTGGRIEASKGFKPKNPRLLFDPKEIFLGYRILCECLLGIASSNDAIEADLFGPKRNHRKFQAPYDKTADYIEFEQYDHAGKKFTRKQDRKKFEKLFLGMTSEEEAATTFEVPEHRRFSWTDIKSFLRCERCFYITKKYGIKFNNFDKESFGLANATDTLLKREFEQYRQEHKMHPIMKGSKAIKPLKHKKINQWKSAFDPETKSYGGIQFHDVWENWTVYGGVDDVWLNENKELIIVDYKSSIHQVSMRKNYKDYQKQIEFYAWIFKKNNYRVAQTGYLLVYYPITTKATFDWQLHFTPELEEVPINDAWVSDAINKALECLSKDTLPSTGKSGLGHRVKCDLCNYFEKLAERLQEIPVK